MKERMVSLIRLSALLVVAGSWTLASMPALAQSHDPSVPSLSNSQLERLANGEVLVEVVPGEVPYGDAIGVVNAPSLQVIEVIRDFGAYSEWMSDIAESEVVSEEGENRYVCRGVTDTPWPMSDREWSVNAWGGEQQVDGVDAIVSAWEYIPDSGNIINSIGYWLLIPWGDDGNQTLVRYHLMVDLGTWLPDFLLEWSTENFLPSKITDLRARLGV